MTVTKKLRSRNVSARALARFYFASLNRWDGRGAFMKRFTWCYDHALKSGGKVRSVEERQDTYMVFEDAEEMNAYARFKGPGEVVSTEIKQVEDNNGAVYNIYLARLA